MGERNLWALFQDLQRLPRMNLHIIFNIPSCFIRWVMGAEFTGVVYMSERNLQAIFVTGEAMGINLQRSLHRWQNFTWICRIFECIWERVSECEWELACIVYWIDLRTWILRGRSWIEKLETNLQSFGETCKWCG